MTVRVRGADAPKLSPISVQPLATGRIAATSAMAATRRAPCPMTLPDGGTGRFVTSEPDAEEERALAEPEDALVECRPALAAEEDRADADAQAAADRVY